MPEGMLSGLRHTPSVEIKSHSLWDFFISWPNGKLGLLGLLAQACCIYISSNGRSSSSVFKIPCPSCVEIQESGACSGLVAAGNKSTTLPPLPPPRCGGEWEETGRNWWVGIRAV